MVPHSIITVSLATAILPRLSAPGRRPRPARPGHARSAGTLRTALARDRALRAAAAADRARRRQRDLASAPPATATGCCIASLALFGPGLVFFTVHYLMLRGFYALERTRTVFFDPVRDRGHQHRGGAGAGRARPTPELTSPALVVAYTASYAVGSVLSYLRAAPRARRPADPRRCSASWCGWRSRPAISTAAACARRPRCCAGLGDEPDQLVAARAPGSRPLARGRRRSSWCWPGSCACARSPRCSTPCAGGCRPRSR